MNIKKLFCKHEETEEKVIYRDCKYNEYFGKVIITEHPYVECKRCGKIAHRVTCKPTFLENIEIEKIEEFKEKRRRESNSQ